MCCFAVIINDCYTQRIQTFTLIVLLQPQHLLSLFQHLTWNLFTLCDFHFKMNGYQNRNRHYDFIEICIFLIYFFNKHFSLFSDKFSKPNFILSWWANFLIAYFQMDHVCSNWLILHKKHSGVKIMRKFWCDCSRNFWHGNWFSLRIWKENIEKIRRLIH